MSPATVSLALLLLLAGGVSANRLGEPLQTPSVQDNGFQYGIYLDAGSTGTRIYIYKWDKRDFDSVPPVLTQIVGNTLLNEKLTPGISSFAANPAGAVSNIKILLDAGIDKLKTEGITDHSTVPVFLGATAGMRMLDPHQVTAILKNIQATVKASGFMYNAEWIRVLSGEQEGVFGWISANWMLHTFNGPSDKTFGALDLGGASTQVTFHPDEAILDGFFPLEVATTCHQLYTHSYLYYGNDQARYRVLDGLVDTPSLAKNVTTNPCFPTGYSSKGISPEHPDVIYVGSSNWEGCMAETKKLITDFQTTDKKDCLHSSHIDCTFTGVYMPKLPENMDMVAVSTFYLAWMFFGLEFGADKRSDDLDALQSKAATICSMDKIQFEAYAMKTLGNMDSKSYNFCTSAGYIHALLSVGYGFPTKNTPIRVVNKIDGNDVEWTYGAMLYEINRLGWTYKPLIPHDSSSSLQGPLVGVSISLGVVSIVAIVAIVLLARSGTCWKRQDQSESMYDRF